MSINPFHLRRQTKLFDKQLLQEAFMASFHKLHPLNQIQNFVMLVVYVGAISTTAICFFEKFQNIFNLQMALWLWFTVLFANFAEALSEGRGKAQAASLRKTRKETVARQIIEGHEKPISSSDLKIGDIVVCEAGDLIPGDGEVIEGAASVDESAITGESAPVIRESGGDR
jgi:K+-transporting ATPase ATPase B chain